MEEKILKQKYESDFIDLLLKKHPGWYEDINKFLDIEDVVDYSIILHNHNCYEYNENEYPQVDALLTSEEEYYNKSILLSSLLYNNMKSHVKDCMILRIKTPILLSSYINVLNEKMINNILEVIYLSYMSYHILSNIENIENGSILSNIISLINEDVIFDFKDTSEVSLYNLIKEFIVYQDIEESFNSLIRVANIRYKI